jgi:alkylation response protein AidB-like acyl-CoA dehydrogenase
MTTEPASAVSDSLLDTDVDQSLRSSVRAVLERRCTPEAVTRLYDGDRSVVDPLWVALAKELGLAGLLVAEDHGGAGASAREAAVVMEELGRRCAPAPFLTSAVVATTVLDRAGATELLAPLAAGERVACLVVPLSAGPGCPSATVSLGADGRLDGHVRSVAGALEADLLVVPVNAGGETALAVVDRADSGIRVESVTSLDMTRQVADVHLDGVAARVVAEGAAATGAVEDALTLGAALLASEQVGVARWCVETTIAYLGERRQFGRVVGGYQALKHRLADLWVRVESADAAARYAAVTAAAGDSGTTDAALAASVAQAYCADVAVRATEECIQLHGGIGMTWEYPAHLYLKRAKADQIALGSPGRHRDRVARLADLPPPDARS